MPGKVFLVGAGPGDPGLITLKGLECLARADVVLYDGLVNPLLLRHSHAQAIRTCRANPARGQLLKQDEINKQLIAAAREGKTVVRLKGGDPFIFGRGSEEAAALAAAGIPFEVVPGVTAAVATSAYAGISLTHRDYASAVAFITGHEDPQKPESALDYRALATFPGTLVFYMGLHRLKVIAETLIQCGKDPATPSAVICRGTTPAQRTVVAPLRDLAQVASEAGLHAPSMTIVGDCIRQRDLIGWFESKPLFGKRIGITRPASQAEQIIREVVELGAEPVLMPTIEIRSPAEWTEVDQTLKRLEEYDWIVFTSVNGVEALLGRLWETGGDARRLGRARIAAIGDGTANALASFRLRADLIPATFRAEALAEALRPHVGGKRVLWPRASRGRDVLPTELTAAGARVDELVVYQNVDVEAFDPSVIAALETGALDWIGLSSPSIARNLSRLLPEAARAHLGSNMRLASISPLTTVAAQEAGLPVAVEAREHTWLGMLQAIAGECQTNV